MEWQLFLLGPRYGEVNIYSILFERNMAIVSVDFFAGDSGNGTINSLRNSVATWYISLRNLAIVALVVILVYVGIRMALSTVAGEEAKYKKMLKHKI